MDNLINETGILAKTILFLTKKRQRYKIYNKTGQIPIFDDYDPKALEKLHKANIEMLDNLTINYFSSEPNVAIPKIGPQFRIK